MSHKILRIAEAVFNRPQLMHPERFKTLVDYLVDRNSGKIEFDKLTESLESVNNKQKIDSSEDQLSPEQELQKIGVDPNTMIGQINIEGTLVYRETACESLCGLTSYQRTLKNFQSQIDAGVNTVLMYVDSGGGEAYGCFETAAQMRQIANDAGVKIIAYVDGMAASGGYGLACIADELIMNPDAQVGSIGVVVQLINNSQALEKAGLERVFVFAGDNKIPFGEDGKFTESFINRIQDGVDKTYEKFVSFVAANRHLSNEAVRETKADVFDSEDAMNIGLADKSMTRDEFFNNYINNFASSNKNLNQKNGVYTLEQQKVQDNVQVVSTETDVVNQVTDAVTDTNVSEQVAQLTTELSTTKEAASKLLAENEALQTQVTQLTTDLANFKEQAKIDSRKQALSACLDVDTVPSVLQATANLSDEAFQTILSTYQKAHQAAKVEMAEIGSKAEMEIKSASLTADQKLSQYIEQQQKNK